MNDPTANHKHFVKKCSCSLAVVLLALEPIRLRPQSSTRSSSSLNPFTNRKSHFLKSSPTDEHKGDREFLTLSISIFS